MKRATPVYRFLQTQKEVYDFDGEWYGAFANPEKYGVWFVWGNSGNGKTNFLAQLTKYMSRFGKVLYDSLEEGESLSLQKAFRRAGMSEVGKKVTLVRENITELDARLKRRRSADIVVIDSIQYLRVRFVDFVNFTRAHPNKLFIVVSQAKGKQPKGQLADDVMYDASLKIWVEGHRAISKGRFIGNDPHYTIYPEGAERYWD